MVSMMKRAATALGMAAVLASGIGAATAVSAQSATTPTSAWRTVAPENLLVIETPKGRILVELEPRMAPNHVVRIRTLADRGFYDGLAFHRVIADFMAQTGDPEGTGAGQSDLPDVPGEFAFRRGRDGFTPVPTALTGVFGLFGSVPVQTQPDAQMMINADFRVEAHGLFCPGVVGMARAGSPDSANSQFFLMSGRNASLDGSYTVFGRVLEGLPVVKSLKAGPSADDGKVTNNPDRMTRVRTAAAMPEGERPVVRVLDPASADGAARIEALRAASTMRFTICDVQPVVEVTR